MAEETKTTDNGNPEIAVEKEQATSANLQIPLNKIVRDETQPREEMPEEEIVSLAENIKANGLITPIIVTMVQPGQYKIVDGERRWRACKLLAEKGEIKGSINAFCIGDDGATLKGILANIARKSYNPMEYAIALEQIKLSLGDDAIDLQVAKLVDKSRSNVTEYLSLLKLPEAIQASAKKDSCVPFRELKSLAASDMTDEDKVVKYNKLHEKYKTLPQDTDKKKVTRQPSLAREINTVKKKIENISETLERFGRDKIDKPEQKETLMKSLDDIINVAQEVKNKLKQ